MHFYNDTEPFVCSWLEQLTKHNHLPHGTIDQRPIQQLTAADLAPYTQCHFFAGIGGWPLALRLAGWPDDMPVWTGSCPCQPFSCAGQGRGTDDERHLWPEWFRLIKACRPPVIFGEQVCSVAVVGKQSAKGRRVSEKIQIQEPGEGLDETCTDEGKQEETSVRSGSTSIGIAGAYRQRLMRDFWPAVQPRWWEDMGQPVFRQDQPENGLHLYERQDCSTCAQQCNGGLGRVEDAGNSEGNNGSPVERLQRALGIARAELDEEIVRLWLTGVRLDLEEIGYSVGACVLPAAGVGAPHIRQRLFWMAYAQRDRGHNGRRALRASDGSVAGREAQERGADMREVEGHGATGGVAYTQSQHNRSRQPGTPGRFESANRCPTCRDSCECIACYDDGTQDYRCSRHGVFTGEMEHTTSNGREQRRTEPSGRCAASGREPCSFWTNAEWLQCLDGKARRIEPGTFPLAHGVPARVGRLRGYGNAIVPPLAAEFIQAAIEAIQLATT